MTLPAPRLARPIARRRLPRAAVDDSEFCPVEGPPPHVFIMKYGITVPPKEQDSKHYRRTKAGINLVLSKVVPLSTLLEKAHKLMGN